MEVLENDLGTLGNLTPNPSSKSQIKSPSNQLLEEIDFRPPPVSYTSLMNSLNPKSPLKSIEGTDETESPDSSEPKEANKPVTLRLKVENPSRVRASIRLSRFVLEIDLNIIRGEGEPERQGFKQRSCFISTTRFYKSTN